MVLAAGAILSTVGIVCLAASGFGMSIEQATLVGRAPRIEPDYADAVIPPNIAPLNFRVREEGTRYLVRILSERQQPSEIRSRSSEIRISEERWRTLLQAHRGAQLSFEVLVQTESGWERFDAFRLTVANEDIDNYLVYRRIHPAHSAWRDMGIYQRDLRTFEESAVLTNDYFRGGCVNCHTFRNNRTDTMLVSTRSGDYGNSAVIVRDGKVEKVGATLGYASWHPNGKILAYTSMKVAMFLHPATEEVRDVIDLDSLLAYYDTKSQRLGTSPELARKDRLETYPTWSPDGRYLYFSSAPLTWTNRNAIPEQYDQIQYDLVRVPYDSNQGTWGPAETVLAAKNTGRSILLPRISPDGRWLLVSMCDYGCFPAYRRSSDLYVIDLETAQRTGRYETRRLEINSDQSESWHSWSSNSRWIAFSSKRDNGLFTRTYLSYVDINGVVHKPIVLPQEDPTDYDSCLWTYSVPELVVEPVRATKETLGRVVRGSRKISVEMPITMATPKADAAPQSGTPYQSGRE
jgi:Tol biopolymer transport system component